MKKPFSVEDIARFYWAEVVAEIGSVICARMCGQDAHGGAYCGTAHYAAKEVLSHILRGHEKGKAWADGVHADACMERDMALAAMSDDSQVRETGENLTKGDRYSGRLADGERTEDGGDG